MAEEAQEGILKIEDARITWPSLYEKEVFEGVETKYKVTLMIPKDDPRMKIIGSAIQAAMEAKKENVPMDAWCVKDGDDSKYDSEDGHWLITIGSRQQPILLNEDGTMSNQDEGEFYSGCYCTALISFWVNVKRQKRVVGELHALQKTSDGERLSGGIGKSTAVEMLLGKEGAAKAMGKKDDMPF